MRAQTRCPRLLTRPKRLPTQRSTFWMRRGMPRRSPRASLTRCGDRRCRRRCSRCPRSRSRASRGACALNKFRWPLLVYVLYIPWLWAQGSLYRLNPELANVYVMPVLVAVQPALVPLAVIAGASYWLAPKPWMRAVLLAALWAIAIEFLFSMRLE